MDRPLHVCIHAMLSRYLLWRGILCTEHGFAVGHCFMLASLALSDRVRERFRDIQWSLIDAKLGD
jgi:hypothetical protein